MQAGLLFLATVALLIPSAVSEADAVESAFTQTLSLGLSAPLIVAYGLGMLFSLKTHRELFAGAEHAEENEATWPMGLALATLAGVTVLVALASASQIALFVAPVGAASPFAADPRPSGHCAGLIRFANGSCGRHRWDADDEIAVARA